MSQGAHQASDYLGLCSMKRLGVFVLPPTVVKFASTTAARERFPAFRMKFTELLLFRYDETSGMMMCMRDIYDIYIPFIHLMFIYIFKWVGNFLRIESTYQCMEVALSGSEIRGFQLKILRKMNFLRQF